MFNFTQDHQAIKATLANANCVVNAGPGCGKTTTIKMVVIPELLRHFKKGGALAFNGKNAYELKNAINHPAVDCSTAHSAMFGMVRKFFPKAKVEVEQKAGFNKKFKRFTPATESKCQIIAKVLFKDAPTELVSNVLRLVDFMKLEGMGLPNHPAINDTEKLSQLIDSHTLMTILEGETPETVLSKTIGMAILMFEESLKCTGSLDYPDMMYFALYFNCPLPDWDFVVYDEGQDIKPVELEFLRRLHVAGCRIVAVGDDCQSINNFAGGMHMALDFLADSVQAVKCPLRTSFRASHLAAMLANEIFPNSVIPCDTARQGTRYDMGLGEFLPTVESLDYKTGILSRTHRNLMPIALGLLSKAIPFTYKGIGELVEKMKRNLWHNSKVSQNLGDVRQGIVRYIENLQASKAREDGSFPNWVNEVSATCESLCLLLAYCEGKGMDLEGVKQYLDTLADLDKASTGPTLSTIHASKGLEWSSVVILGNTVSSLAKSPEQLHAEKCGTYVALTRSSGDLTFVAM